MVDSQEGNLLFYVTQLIRSAFATTFGHDPPSAAFVDRLRKPRRILTSSVSSRARASNAATAATSASDGRIEIAGVRHGFREVLVKHSTCSWLAARPSGAWRIAVRQRHAQFIGEHLHRSAEVDDVSWPGCTPNLAKTCLGAGGSFVPNTIATGCDAPAPPVRRGAHGHRRGATRAGDVAPTVSVQPSPRRVVMHRALQYVERAGRAACGIGEPPRLTSKRIEAHCFQRAAAPILPGWLVCVSTTRIF